MAEFLLELFSEEIPARMQARAEEDLARLFKAAIQAERLGFGPMETYSTPRRLVLCAVGLPIRQPDVDEERRGPRADAPTKAIEGFCRSTGVERESLEEREEKKGTFLYANVRKEGEETIFILADIVSDIIQKFPWPKSMIWGEQSSRWVRPLHRVLALFDGEILPSEAISVSDVKDQLRATLYEFGNTTSGHRFRAPQPFDVANFADYEKKLKKARVILSADERKAIILDGAKEMAAERGLEPVYSARLLQEVAGLVEWPVLLEGEFDAAFLDVPHEALISEMQQHQKYFPLRSTEKMELTNRFIVVANMPDDTGAIIKGNERVLAARLADAKFFWDQDIKLSLEDCLLNLGGLVFHAKLGTIADKAVRMERLAREIAAYVPGCDADLAARAALIAKADLVTGMVGEFPDLQGIMGGYYARAHDEGEVVASAIDHHYSPVGPDDFCPHEPVAIAVALADKIDTLVGFFMIDEKPTGSRDPFALRRAALGVVRLILENELRIGLFFVFEQAYVEMKKGRGTVLTGTLKAGKTDRKITTVSRDVLAFLIDRMKVQLRDAGLRHDHVDAVTAGLDEDDMVRLERRVRALQHFLGTEDGTNLLAGYKRAVNIVKIEEKKDKTTYDGDPDSGLLAKGMKEERSLAGQLEWVKEAIPAAAEAEDYESIMTWVATLRQPIDDFFDSVTVNTDDTKIRANRLRLLASIRTALDPVADFSKLEG